VVLAELLKQRRRDLVNLGGGQQATFLTEEMLRPGHIDAVVRGKGEFALCEILAAGDYRGVAGVPAARSPAAATPPGPCAATTAPRPSCRPAGMCTICPRSAKNRKAYGDVNIF